MATWATRSWRAMGSDAQILVYAPDPEPLVIWAVAEIERLEACWSRFRRTSELSRLNRAPGFGPFDVSPVLRFALDAALEATTMTGGGFDATVLDALEALGYDRRFELITVADVRPASPAPGCASLSFDDDGRLRRPDGVRIDLGGIGKGLAADLVTDGLIARGATSACLSMGGDVAVRGPGPGTDAGWPVPVRTALDDRPRFEFTLVDEAIVQSTTLLRRWRRGSGEAHHIVDPATGMPADTGVVAAIVTGRRAAMAEAIAKAALIVGLESGCDLIAATGHDGWLVAADGTLLATEHVADTVLVTEHAVGGVRA